jgi:protein-S-isoprenylcysteine O-methyltransferase Ste14
MDIMTVHEFGLWNAWWFMLVFPLQMLAVMLLPKRIGERVSHPSGEKKPTRDRILDKLTEILWIGATLYSIVIPFITGTAWFYTGLVCFIAGLAVLVLSVVTVAQTPEGEPFSDGIYKISRHPMYLSMILVYLGVSIASASWIFLLITVITVYLQNHQMGEEESRCITVFGESYKVYLEKTPRWIGMPR